MYIAKIYLNSVSGGSITFIRTTPNKWDTKRLLWQHRLPSNGTTKLYCVIEYIKNAKAYKL